MGKELFRSPDSDKRRNQVRLMLVCWSSARGHFSRGGGSKAEEGEEVPTSAQSVEHNTNIASYREGGECEGGPGVDGGRMGLPPGETCY